MKKFITFIMLLILGLFASSCNNGTSNSDSTGNSDSTSNSDSNSNTETEQPLFDENAVVVGENESIICDNITFKFVNVSENQEEQVKLKFRLVVSAVTDELFTIFIDDIKVIDKDNSYECYSQLSGSYTYAMVGLGPDMPTTIQLETLLPTATEAGDYYFTFAYNDIVYAFDLD